MIGEHNICAVVAGRDARAMRKQLESALGARSRVIELRLDWLGNEREMGRFLRVLASHLGPNRPSRRATLIATCRRRVAGGNFRGSIASQLTYLAEAVRAGCEWYDLEIETIRLCPRELLDALLGEGHRLASAHFFHGMPRNLPAVCRELLRTRSAAIKLAARCDSLADGRKLLSLARRKPNVVAIPMGDVALPLRVLALREGSALSYAPVETPTAPGQVSLEEMKNLYRAERLDRRTGVYGIVGNPVTHSLSPAMQNAAFETSRINSVYVRFPVRDLGDFVRAIVPMGIRGFSVTLPHKQAILRHLDGCDRLAAAIGAVNTVVVRGGGRLYGYNTDYVGVLGALEPRIPLRGARVLVLGAGGAARAVAFALAWSGAFVSICARRASRGRQLAQAVDGEAIEREGIRRRFFDVIVNATPVGMYPQVSESPLEARDLNCRLVFDTIYRPRATKLLEIAARRRIGTVSGFEMFVAQGAAQFEIWTGRRAPVQVMRRAALRGLDGSFRSS
jgi:3-dehydroquinate dehydratase / shikimate dehydrogenase